MTRRKQLSDEFVSRWGDKELDDTQYITIPGWILRNYSSFTTRNGEKVGLTADEFQTMVHIMSFKYDVPGSEAKPSLKTIAQQMGKHETSVRRTVKRLEEKGVLSVDRSHRGKPNVYDFRELTRQCRYFEGIREKTPSVDATPSVHASSTPSVDATPDLAYTLDEDIEVKSEIKKENIPPIGGAEKPVQPHIALIDAYWAALPGGKPYGASYKRYVTKATAAQKDGATPEQITVCTRAFYDPQSPIYEPRNAKRVVTFEEVLEKMALFEQKSTPPTPVVYDLGTEADEKERRKARLQRLQAKYDAGEFDERLAV